MKPLLLLLIFLTSLLLYYGLFLLFSKKDQRLKKRMANYFYDDEKNIEPKVKKQSFNSLLKFQLSKIKRQKKAGQKGQGRKLALRLQRAGLSISPFEFAFFRWVAFICLTGLFYFISGHIIGGVIGIVVGLFAPGFWLKRKEKQRERRFNEGLGDMITAIIGSLRAGFSFPQSLKMVAEESESPIKEEMESVMRELQYGSSIEEALNHLYERVPSEDLALMIQAIVIQRQVGGNLATVLDKIVQTIRERTKIQGQISTLTAQGRLSGIVIGLLPIILGVLFYFIQPAYITTLFKNPIGIIMVVVGLVSGFIGFMMIRKITNIEV